MDTDSTFVNAQADAGSPSGATNVGPHVIPGVDPRAGPNDSPAPLHWLNRFASLGPAFYTALQAQGLPDPHWVARSDDCARALGWPADWYRRADFDALAVFSGNASMPGMQPLASVYSGHQFGVWAGQLGDGRALLLGELQTPNGPMELQLKGAGLTPYSRMGDGRAVLRSSVREYLCSEAIHHLGIPTSRALCLIGSALPVRREQIETAAVVTRVAPSFIRFGHFEHFCHHGQPAALQQLVDFVIAHHYPECADAAVPAAALLKAVALRTARLMADWQVVGFCHGVMNTDNLSILGLTIDYGPFGFLDGYDPDHICNHSDDRGRYAFARQPQVGLWNLHALAQALMPLVGADTEPLREALEAYRDAYAEQMSQRWRAKLGLASAAEGDDRLAQDFLQCMATDRVDHTIAWRRLAGFQPGWATSSATAAGATIDSATASSTSAPANAPLRDLFIDRPAFDGWATRYAARLRQEGSDDAERAVRMRAVNPKFVLRNHLAQAAIERAEAGDFTEIDRLLQVLSRPFDEQPAHEADAGFPPDWAQHLAVSCSS